MRKVKGFTLIELMIVVAIIAIIAAIAIPNLLRSRMAANESATVGSMKTVATQEAIYKQQSETDDDDDGIGEYGFLCEMCGEVPPRKSAAAAGGAIAVAPVTPIYISQQFATGGSTGTGVAEKSGFVYRLYLPVGDPAADAAADAIDDTAAGAPGAAAWPTNAWSPNRAIANRNEASFCVYTWPVEINSTGQRAFFINEVGETYGTKMTMVTYTGMGAAMPEINNYGAAYENDGTGDGYFNNRIGGDAAAGTTSVDTNIWTPAG